MGFVQLRFFLLLYMVRCFLAMVNTEYQRIFGSQQQVCRCPLFPGASHMVVF